MYDWRSKQDINISGSINENLHVWDHRPPDSSASWGTWLALGLGAIGLISAFSKKSGQEEVPKALPPPVLSSKPVEESHFKLVHEFLKTTEESLIRTGDTKSCYEDLDSFCEVVSEMNLKFSEIEDFVLGRLLKRIARLLKMRDPESSF